MKEKSSIICKEIKKIICLLHKKEKITRKQEKINSLSFEIDYNLEYKSTKIYIFNVYFGKENKIYMSILFNNDPLEQKICKCLKNINNTIEKEIHVFVDNIFHNNIFWEKYLQKFKNVKDFNTSIYTKEDYIGYIDLIYLKNNIFLSIDFLNIDFSHSKIFFDIKYINDHKYIHNKILSLE